MPVPRLGLALIAGCTFGASAAASVSADGFAAENAAAMSAMHAAMHIEPTGDVDRDFVAMMIPHHRGGIDMARAVLRYGKTEQVRRLAQEIIIEQQEEIEALRRAVCAIPSLRPSGPARSAAPSAATEPCDALHSSPGA